MLKSGENVKIFERDILIFQALTDKMLVPASTVYPFYVRPGATGAAPHPRLSWPTRSRIPVRAERSGAKSKQACRIASGLGPGTQSTPHFSYYYPFG